MLIIKNKQIRVFEAVSFPSFETKMLNHIEDHFTPMATLLGKDGLRKLIYHGYERAKKYGFATGYEVCLFTDIMILLGTGFDTDPQFPWARDILINRNMDATSKIEKLYEDV